jgi:CO dehydrogenase nickel-insertion accessory protein CooC1
MQSATDRTAMDFGLPVEGFIPEDEAVIECDLAGSPTSTLGKESRAVVEAGKVFGKILSF